MKYLVIGAGGTGGCIGGYLADAGRDVTLIARGKHLEAIRRDGLVLHGTRRGELRVPGPRLHRRGIYRARGRDLCLRQGLLGGGDSAACRTRVG